MGRQHKQQKKEYKAKTVLLDDWRKKCDVYQHAEQEPIDKSRCRLFNPQRCHVLGMCLCSLPQVSRFQQQLLPHLKRVCAKKAKTPTVARVLLEERRLFLGFGYVDGEEPEAGEVARPHVFFHVSSTNLKTWRFAGVKMSPISWHDEQGYVLLQVVGDGVTSKAASEQALTDFAFISRFLDSARACRLSFYCLSREPSHWPAQTGVNVVPACHLPDSEQPVFWHGSQAAVASRGARPRRVRPPVFAEQDPLEQALSLLGNEARVQSDRADAAPPDTVDASAAVLDAVGSESDGRDSDIAAADAPELDARDVEAMSESSSQGDDVLDAE